MGFLHIYCGEGKGKTTAAIGLAIRAAGAGMRVCLVQLMKGREVAELDTLKLIPNISVKRCNRFYGFYKNMNENDKSEITVCHNELLKSAFDGKYNMIILDEFNSAYKHGLIDKELAERQILDGKNIAEIVLTGRNPAEIFLENADYVSEITCVKHPYKAGVKGRNGIEY